MSVSTPGSTPRPPGPWSGGGGSGFVLPPSGPPSPASARGPPPSPPLARLSHACSRSRSRWFSCSRPAASSSSVFRLQPTVLLISCTASWTTCSSTDSSWPWKNEMYTAPFMFPVLSSSAARVPGPSSSSRSSRRNRGVFERSSVRPVARFLLPRLGSRSPGCACSAARLGASAGETRVEAQQHFPAHMSWLAPLTPELEENLLQARGFCWTFLHEGWSPGGDKAASVGRRGPPHVYRPLWLGWPHKSSRASRLHAAIKPSELELVRKRKPGIPSGT
ncbi:hypothetical protein EYF80_053585 [Liparis tanakae]|uniref:Uncharacterized protein n=1 Tax=Liparis tanakae TaxID=230148 RepID=A0A4Z2F7E1_9TELE|nr:hypothetical protein EYF80_053585 [Liparis tanakae]